MKVAIVGCGGIGKIHARAYKTIPGIELMYMIDRIPEAATAAAAEFGAIPLTNITDMEERPDIVSVVTPPSAHYDVIMKLIDNGINVFTEKPLTTDAEQAAQIVSACESKKVQVAVGFKMRYEPIFVKARELIGNIGKIYSVSVVKNQPYNPRPNGWVPDTGCMYELSVHEYDLVCWIAGIMPESVRAELCYDMGWKRENRAYLDVDYSGGIKGQLMSIYSPDTKFTFNDLTITYVGEKGYMRVERPDRIFLHTDSDQIFTVVPEDNTVVFAKELKGFADSLEKRIIYTPGAREGAAMTYMVEAARASSEIGERVPIRR